MEAIWREATERLGIMSYKNIETKEKSKQMRKEKRDLILKRDKKERTINRKRAIETKRGRKKRNRKRWITEENIYIMLMNFQRICQKHKEFFW